MKIELLVTLELGKTFQDLAKLAVQGLNAQPFAASGETGEQVKEQKTTAPVSQVEAPKGRANRGRSAAAATEEAPAKVGGERDDVAEDAEPLGQPVPPEPAGRRRSRAAEPAAPAAKTDEPKEWEDQDEAEQLETLKTLSSNIMKSKGGGNVFKELMGVYGVSRTSELKLEDRDEVYADLTRLKSVKAEDRMAELDKIHPQN